MLRFININRSKGNPGQKYFFACRADTLGDCVTAKDAGLEINYCWDFGQYPE